MYIKINQELLKCEAIRTGEGYLVDKAEFLSRLADSQAREYAAAVERVGADRAGRISLSSVAEITRANEMPTSDSGFVYLFYSNPTLKAPNTILDPATSVSNFRQFHRCGPYRIITHDHENGRKLPETPQQADFSKMTYISGGERYSVEQFLRDRSTMQMLVLKDGRIAGRWVDKGFSGNDPFVSMSVAKSLTSLCLCAALDDGLIGSMEDKLTKYVPELEDSGYRDVTIRQASGMRSGIDWVENNTDGTQGRFFEMFDYAFNGGKKSIHQYLVDIKEKRCEPDASFNYVTVDCHAVEWAVSNAVGMSLSDYFSKRIWSRIGTSQDAKWVTDLHGNEFSGSFFSAVPEDLAKLGQMVLDGGCAGGERILSAERLREFTTAREMVHEDPRDPGTGEGYNAFWWIPLGGGVRDYIARGIFGQFIYINETRRVVIVRNSIDYSFDGQQLESTKVLRAIAEQI